MAGDFNKPAAGDTYVNVLSSIRELFADNIKMLDGTGSTNVPSGAIRWSAANKRWEKYNGSTWAELLAKASDKYDINVDRVDGYDAGNASGNIPVSNGTVNTNLNADLLDGNHASSFVLAPPQGQGGVRRLYRNDSTDNYNVQTYWTGTRWRLKGYINDTFHAEAEVAYADSAGSTPNATTAANLTGFTNGTSSSPTAGADAGTQNGLGYVTGISLFGQSDGALYSQAASTARVGQIYQDYRTGQLAHRGKNSGTWTAWSTIWSAWNFDPNTKADLSGAAFTGAISFPNIATINGTSPPNGVLRMTPNLHLNAGSGSAVILNWDNGTTGTGQALRVGNGAASDAFYVRADGYVWASQYGWLHDKFAGRNAALQSFTEIISHYEQGGNIPGAKRIGTRTDGSTFNLYYTNSTNCNCNCNCK